MLRRVAQDAAAVTLALRDAGLQVATAAEETWTRPVPAEVTTGSWKSAPAKEARAQPTVDEEVAQGHPPPPVADHLDRPAVVDPMLALMTQKEFIIVSKVKGKTKTNC
ncbi:UNVERIFIED_CONTAM: hypothetical protein K2H54_060578 [Gekko kuhli]